MPITPAVARCILLLSVALTLTGCATSGTLGGQGRNPPEDGGGFGFWEQADSLQRLQRAAGLEEDPRLAVGEALEIDDVRG